MRLLLFICGVGLLLGPPVLAQPTPPRATPASLRIVWADVDRFWRAYDQLATARSTADSVAIVQTQYLAPATPGLRAYLDAASATAADYLRALRTHRQYLTANRAAMLSIGRQQGAIRRAARRLQRLYPAATFPDLYFAVGKFEVGGSALGRCSTSEPS